MVNRKNNGDNKIYPKRIIKIIMDLWKLQNSGWKFRNGTMYGEHNSNNTRDNNKGNRDIITQK